MRKELVLKGEVLEERIAPGILSVAVPAADQADGNAPSSVPEGGASVPEAGAAANGRGPVTVS